MSFLKAKNYSIIGLRERLSKIKMYFFDKRYRNRKINDQEYDNIDIQLKSNPSIYILGLTNICNLKCPLCITGLRKQKKKLGHMPFELFKNIIDKIHPYARLVQLYSWGESLLHPNFIDMLKYCNSYSFETEISSNFSLKNIDNHLDALVKYQLTHLIVSFDGTNQEDYSRYRVGGDYQLVLENIRKLKEIKLRSNSKYPIITLQFLKNKYTKDQIKILSANYKKWGADKFTICEMTTIFKDNKFLNISEWLSNEDIKNKRYFDIDKSMLKVVCPFIYKFMLIDHDGSMPPCCFTTDPKDDFATWENDKSINEMYNSVKYINTRYLFKNQLPNSQLVCNNCSIFLSYKGGDQ